MKQLDKIADFVFHVCEGRLRGCRKACCCRNILGSGAPPSLLTAAVDQRLQPGAVPDI